MSTDANAAPDLVTSAEVQALAGVSVQTVRLWARQGRLGPKHFLPTCNRGAVAYERSHVLAALADRPPNRNRRRRSA